MWVSILVFNFIFAAAATNETFYPLPRFWTNTGFCPSGDISHEGISSSLLTNEVKLNLQLIGALPNGALSSIRIHWLLELVQLIEFGQHSIPTYDFNKLDRLVWWLDRSGLSLGFEFMGNPSGIFTKNESIADFLWEDLSFQIGKRYLNRLGPSKLERWRFESWNEPDLHGYNILNFNIEKFQVYLDAIRRGLNAASRRPLNSVNFKLHGPAGLFKEHNHQLCWSALEKCNANIDRCPLDVLTFHHKGYGRTREVTEGGEHLLKEIFNKYPNLANIPVANNEADPIAGWSTPRDSQADMRYAIEVITIIFDHWEAKLNSKEFKHLDFISHDNAFMSYHPYEFSQRTLLAHFRMNDSKPYPYSQFIQKPVYAALGIMGNLGTHATAIENLNPIRIWKTTDENGTEFLSLIAICDDTAGTVNRFQKEIKLRSMKGNRFSYVVEYLEYQNTDPVFIWNYYNSPPFPNSHVRESMRRSQGPRLYTTGTLNHPLLYMNLPLRSPWLVHIKMCSNSISHPHRPRKLHIVSVTTNEILLLWKEHNHSSRCVSNYQVWFLPLNSSEWMEITDGWHISFLSFHFAPKDNHVQGTYKVRSIDTFGRSSEFSKAKNYTTKAYISD